MPRLLLWPGQLDQSWYSANGLVVWRLERKLVGQKSDTVASGFGIQSVGRVIDFKCFWLTHNLKVLLRDVCIQERFIGPVLQEYGRRRRVGDNNSGEGAPEMTVKTPPTRCWLKTDATKHISRIWQLARILERNGAYVKKIRTEKPGYVIYEDEW